MAWYSSQAPPPRATLRPSDGANNARSWTNARTAGMAVPIGTSSLPTAPARHRPPMTAQSARAARQRKMTPTTAQLVSPLKMTPTMVMTTTDTQDHQVVGVVGQSAVMTTANTLDHQLVSVDGHSNAQAGALAPVDGKDDGAANQGEKKAWEGWTGQKQHDRYCFRAQI